MVDSLFRGVFTALVTPFRDAQVDEKAFVRLIERQIAAGIKGLVPVGTTGETATLSHEEHRRVVKLCIEVCAGRVPVIAGAGSNATAESIELARHAKTLGAEAALVVTPYYNRPSQEGLYQHYRAITDAVALPLIVYNVPKRTSVDISHETLMRLSHLPGILGVKDATGDMERPSLQRLDCGADWLLLSGDDASTLGYIAHGGHGSISVTSNVAPEACVALMSAALAGDFVKALSLQDQLIGLHEALFLDASPAPTKWALSELGLCRPDLRLPLTPCSEAARVKVKAAMTRLGLNAS